MIFEQTLSNECKFFLIWFPCNILLKSISVVTLLMNEQNFFFKDGESLCCLRCHSSTGGPRYSRTFYLRIRLFTFEKWPRMTLFLSKMDFLSSNSRFTVGPKWRNVSTANNEGNLYNVIRDTFLADSRASLICLF